MRKKEVFIMANKKITIAEQFAEVEKFLRENGKNSWQILSQRDVNSTPRKT